MYNIIVRLLSQLGEITEDEWKFALDAALDEEENFFGSIKKNIVFYRFREDLKRGVWNELCNIEKEKRKEKLRSIS